jgi:hypothetical protein
MEASCLSLNLCHSFGRFQEMQNGLHTDKVANNNRVLPSGGGGSFTVHHGSQAGDGTVLPLDGDTVGDGGRGNSCASSRSERAADLRRNQAWSFGFCPQTRSGRCGETGSSTEITTWVSVSFPH